MKLIDAETMWDCPTCFYHLSGGCTTYCDHGESYRPAMNKLKVIDAMPVVRCNECKWFEEKQCGRQICMVVTDNDFCSYGEKRVQNE